MNELELQLMSALLEGDHPVLAVLRQQLAVVEVVDREYTGVGFFTNLRVPASAPRFPQTSRLVLGDVHAEVEGLQHGVGFLLFVDNGALQMLEGFSYVDSWRPTETKLKRLLYMHQLPGNPQLIETTRRDLDYALAGVRP
jgi:hypothetical protein